MRPWWSPVQTGVAGLPEAGGKIHERQHPLLLHVECGSGGGGPLGHIVAGQRTGPHFGESV
jgi:hypothetical protein